MKVLVAVDSSKYAQAAVKSVTDFFRPQNTEVRVLHVLAPVLLETPPQMSSGYAPELEAEGKEARALVDKYAEQLRAEGYTADSVVDTGDVRERIINWADSWHADLILLGSRGHKGMARLLLGSVAESVARHANCSVLVVRPPASA